MDLIKQKITFKHAPVKPFVYVDAKILPGKIAVYVEDLNPKK